VSRSDPSDRRDASGRSRTIALFDLDGTLTDPAAGITRSLAHALDAVGRPRPDHTTLLSLIGPPLVDAFGEMGLDGDETERAIAAYRDRYSRVGMYENALVPGIDDLLHELTAAGFTLAVATSKPEPFAHSILGHFGLDGQFPVVAGATFDQSRRHKDEVVLHALEHLGLPDPSTVVMIGDREHDVQGAAVHGVATIGVLWGYGSRTELQAAGASSIVETVADLRKSLLG
jgi:phosphoglycolate phosphatase